MASSFRSDQGICPVLDHVVLHLESADPIGIAHSTVGAEPGAASALIIEYMNMEKGSIHQSIRQDFLAIIGLDAESTGSGDFGILLAYGAFHKMLIKGLLCSGACHQGNHSEQGKQLP